MGSARQWKVQPLSLPLTGEIGFYRGGGWIPKVGTPEVGNRREFQGNSLLGDSAFRELPWNSQNRGG